jgi:parallel beta-helix repeat protein
MRLIARWGTSAAGALAIVLVAQGGLAYADTAPSPSPPPIEIASGELTPPVLACAVPLSPTSDLAETVADNPGGTVFCLAPGTYVLSATVEPKKGDAFVGTGSRPVINASAVQIGFDDHNSSNVVFENLEIDGAVYGTPCRDKACGRGIWAGNAMEVYDCYFTGNQQAAIAGGINISTGYVLVDDQFVGNGSNLVPGATSGGVKFSAGGTIIGSEAIDNIGQGLWCDVGCEGAVWTVEDNVVKGNTGGGIRYETSAVGALIEGNTVQGNDTGGRFGQGGIQVNSSSNVTVEDNTALNNDVADIIVNGDRKPGLANDQISDNIATRIIGCSLQGVSCTDN